MRNLIDGNQCNWIRQNTSVLLKTALRMHLCSIQSVLISKCHYVSVLAEELVISLGCAALLHSNIHLNLRLFYRHFSK